MLILSHCHEFSFIFLSGNYLLLSCRRLYFSSRPQKRVHFIFIYLSGNYLLLSCGSFLACTSAKNSSLPPMARGLTFSARLTALIALALVHETLSANDQYYCPPSSCGNIKYYFFKLIILIP